MVTLPSLLLGRIKIAALILNGISTEVFAEQQIVTVFRLPSPILSLNTLLNPSLSFFPAKYPELLYHY
jgi:hypothetical protein